MKNLFTLLLIIVFSTSLHSQQIITQWVFNGTTNPNIGEGTASLTGGTIEVDLDDRWRMVGFPDQFEASGTAGAEFMLSTDGYENIRLSYGHRSSGTQSRWAEVQYTLDGGSDWEVLGNNEGGLSPHDVIYNFSFDLSHIPEAADNPDFGFRIVSIFSPVPFNPEEPDEDFEANTAYHRAREEGTGGNPYAGGEDGGNWRLHDVTIMGDPIDDENDTDRDLLYFMVFDGSLANDTPFEVLMFTYSAFNNAIIHYHSSLEGYPYNEEHPLWRKASMERRNAPTPINYLPEGNYGIPYEDADMRGIQIRQPFVVGDLENTVVFHLPTNLHSDILFGFAAKDEGAADMIIIDYSVVEGEPLWITDGLEQSVLQLTGNYQRFLIDFQDIPGVENNPDFRIRMRFGGEDMSADDGNRVTFNNFSLHGMFMDDVSTIEKIGHTGIRVSPNPARDVINVTSVEPGSTIRLIDIHGTAIFQKRAYNESITLNVAGLIRGLYFIQSLAPGNEKPETIRVMVQ